MTENKKKAESISHGEMSSVAGGGGHTEWNFGSEMPKEKLAKVSGGAGHTEWDLSSEMPKEDMAKVSGGAGHSEWDFTAGLGILENGSEPGKVNVKS